MDRVTCPECGYTVGLGVASEPGSCPSCDVPLLLTIEMRAITARQLAAAAGPEAVSGTPAATQAPAGP